MKISVCCCGSKESRINVSTEKNSIRKCYKERFFAFTLAEMMVVMLIMSIILAAMAPVMTTRSKADYSSPWRYSPENASDAYFGISDSSQIAMIGQPNKLETDDNARLIINSTATLKPQISFKRDNQTVGRLQLSSKNIILGNSTQDKLTTGNNNISIGSNNLSEITTGTSNIAIGNDVIPSGTTAKNNIGIGDNSLQSTTGDWNIAIGINAYKSGTGGSNTIIGSSAMSEGEGNNNVALGANALLKTTGNGNIAIGANANNTEAEYTNTTAIGFSSLASDSYSVAVGSGASAISQKAIAIGRSSRSEAIANVAIGDDTYAKGAQSVAIGPSAKSESSMSVAIGNKAESIGGYSTIAIGLSSEASGENALSLGSFAEATEYHSIALGSSAIASNSRSLSVGDNAQTKGDNSIAIGSGAKTDDTDAIAIGYSVKASGESAIALGSNEETHTTEASGDRSIAIGDGAYALGDDGVAIGVRAEARGTSNIAIGTDACSGVTGSNKVCIGAHSGPTDATQKSDTTTESIYIGSAGSFSRRDGLWSNDTNSIMELHKRDTEAIVIVNADLIVRGDLVSMPRKKSGGRDARYGSFRTKYIDNQIEFANTGDPSESFFSDRRLKYVGKEFTSGLDKIRALKVFNYTFKKDETKTPHVGVIAQDLQKVFPNAVKKGTDGFLTIRMEDMFYAMINAIKELDLKYQAQEKRINELEKRIEKLEAKIK